jgi:hypothetical protein
MATPPDFTAGQVLTAAQMNAVGLWLVKTQTIGTAVPSVTVSDAFSADYNHYLIQISDGAMSSGAYLELQLGATTSGYSWGIMNGTGFSTASGNATFASSSSSATIRYMGYGDANGINANIKVFSPNLAKRTVVSAEVMPQATNLGYGITTGYVPNNTQYTSFVIDPEGAVTMTGGTIAVYGYNV